jgi:2-iminobutanoate/2-iminopropanoate deaminase
VQTPQPDGLATPTLPYSPVVAVGDIVATSGQVGLTAAGAVIAPEFEAQARQAFDNLGRCLHAAGCSFADVFKVTVYLSNMEDFEEMNRLYTEFFAPPYPARTTIQAELAIGLAFEIDVLAARAH